MPNKESVTFLNVQNYILDISTQIGADQYHPDLIVGIARGGLVPAVMLSHYFNIPMCSLQFSTRHDFDMVSVAHLPVHMIEDKTILVVDDIADSGRTIAEIKEAWKLINVWKDIKFATLHKRHDCKVSPDYYAKLIEDDAWQIFPWEM